MMNLDERIKHQMGIQGRLSTTNSGDPVAQVNAKNFITPKPVCKIGRLDGGDSVLALVIKEIQAGWIGHIPSLSAVPRPHRRGVHELAPGDVATPTRQIVPEIREGVFPTDSTGFNWQHATLPTRPSSNLSPIKRFMLKRTLGKPTR